MGPEAAAQIAAFIQANLPVTAVPGIPEIVLHKAVPSSGLWRLAAGDEAGFGSPYWAHHWSGGLALARYLLDHPQTVAGQHVLDLGAGSGLVGIAAAKAGAQQVTAAEIDPYARIALSLNAALNGVMVERLDEDMLDAEPPAVDAVLVGDLFYAEDLAARVLRFLDRCLARGTAVWVGDPWRASLPAARLREVARYSLGEHAGAAARPTGVFVLNPAALA